MNFFNSEEQDKPVDEHPLDEVPDLTHMVLEAIGSLSAGESASIKVPTGMKTEDWTPVLNQCYLKKGAFADVGNHIKVEKNEHDGITFIFTDISEKIAELEALQKKFNPKPPNSAALTSWPVGPAAPLPEDNPNDT